MKPTPEEITFVIYNNRSVDGVVMNFLKKSNLDFQCLAELEEQFNWCDRQLREVRTIEVAERDLNLEYTDITYGPDDLAECADLVTESMRQLPMRDADVKWLLARGHGQPNSKGHFYGSLSYVIEHATQRQLDVLGITCHPMLTSILDNDLSGGGIVIPLFSGDRLVNCTTRRISDVGKLKYTQSCPDISVWNLDNIDPLLPTWMTEGLFDMDAINQSGNDRQAVSVSSAMWSVPQLMQLMDKAGKFINIFADNDKVGLRTAAIMQKFMQMNGYVVKTYVSKTCKDPSEHFNERKLGWDDVAEIEITSKMIESQDDMSFNFLKYLKNRKF